jgi:hypothetical protein
MEARDWGNHSWDGTLYWIGLILWERRQSHEVHFGTFHSSDHVRLVHKILMIKWAWESTRLLTNNPQYRGKLSQPPQSVAVCYKFFLYWSQHERKNILLDAIVLGYAQILSPEAYFVLWFKEFFQCTCESQSTFNPDRKCPTIRVMSVASGRPLHFQGHRTMRSIQPFK